MLKHLLIIVDMSLIFFLSMPLLFAQNLEFLPYQRYEGHAFSLYNGEQPRMVYADMDGDKKNEVIIAVQMCPKDKDDPRYFKSFAYIYKLNPLVLLKVVPLGETLGVCLNGGDMRYVDVVDIGHDGKTEVALWSSSGMHYDNLLIIGMRGGRIIPLFDGGSDNQIEYDPRGDNKTIIIGERDLNSLGEEVWREQIWEWNGKKFAHNKDTSTTILADAVVEY